MATCFFHTKASFADAVHYDSLALLRIASGPSFLAEVGFVATQLTTGIAIHKHLPVVFLIVALRGLVVVHRHTGGTARRDGRSRS